MDLLRELQHIQDKGYRFYEEHLGEAVLWAEFDAHGSRFGPVESHGGKRWTSPVLIQCLFVNVREDPLRPSVEGRRVEPQIALAVAMDQAVSAGISNPEDAARHLNDVLFYDNTFWRVTSVQIRGRMSGQSVILGIEGVRLSPDEQAAFDEMPFRDGPFVTRRPVGAINDEDESFPDYPFPAYPGPDD